ncbi:glycolate oxidase iron-sulfur subunit [Nitrosomonas nitrosa]|uniref:Glycolate oxidase iron-sulfur subunit n=1 Tax=Nitrosomonas nitrosa TaxID=52442 RepID=A0A8H8YZD0_9PROT|nr:glycolate oxidase subunit GlcF [Nitrosomonas nitrosa]CAE6503606.1 glycolate oxidase iron-sulfur subunit [Nitrosomonas nitrosa]
MQTNLANFIKHTPEGEEADTILRSCVHCGFCLATCPTYQLLGDELDSPRGRIYLMKQVLEGQSVTQKTQQHLDRCLTCRACETTCPSGVQYSRLLDIGRGVVHKKVKRKLRDRAIRYLLIKTLPNRYLFRPLFKLGQLFRPFLPAKLKKSIPSHTLKNKDWPTTRHSRRMLLLDGCVQPSFSPNINIATANVLDKLGISLIKAEKAGCCGALSYHLDAHQESMDQMRRNIDAWWPFIDKRTNSQPIEAIVITASGCGATVKEYGHLLRHDPAYADKAQHISALAKDISEILALETNALATLFKRLGDKASTKLAFHSPCTLQHGMQIRGSVEKILSTAGFTLCTVKDAHLCCGSAGTYSILQPELSQQLLKQKIAALTSDGPSQLVTANIGCLMHLQSGTSLPVKHWIEILDLTLDAGADPKTSDQ